MIYGLKRMVKMKKRGRCRIQNLNQQWACDSSVDVELFGPIWDNIDSKDGVAERSDERACEPGVENFTSESE